MNTSNFPTSNTRYLKNSRVISCVGVGSGIDGVGLDEESDADET